MDTGKLKAIVHNKIDSHRQQLTELALKIHANPELGFQETKAAAWLTQYLEENGFTIQRGIYELPTAFQASCGQGKPAIAILAEYDALPRIGHACGHNLIATCAVAAGVAAKAAVDQSGGSLLVIGTPAEEIYGGKAIMIERGAFRNLDIAMMAHPGTEDIATIKALACQTLEVEFIGKASHAAARPEAGINALEAMLLSYAAINSLRQHIKSTARVHGIITDGGEAANIVPAHSASSFIVRAEDNAYLAELKEKVLNCFTGAATATGAQLRYQWGSVSYAPMRNNLPLARLFQQNLESLGHTVRFSSSSDSFGSTDMGNVSQIVPGIHPKFAIADKTVGGHSAQFAVAAASEAGIQGMIDTAKALAMTVVDVLGSPEARANIKEKFEQDK